MATYRHITPTDFLEKLHDNQYIDLAGANRAVGRMEKWTDAQRAQAKRRASLHFLEKSAPKHKTTQRAAVQKTANKVVKKATYAKAPSTKQKNTRQLALRLQDEAAKAGKPRAMSFTSWCVKLFGNGPGSNLSIMLSFLRGAADAHLTLPQLLGELEAL